MKYDIIKDFKGSPDGRYAVQYKAGDTEVEMTDSLAEVALKEKWIKVSKSSREEAKAKAVAEEEAAAQAEVAAKEARRAALTEELAQLEADYEAAAEADQPAIHMVWETKQAELAAL